MAEAETDRQTVEAQVSPGLKRAARAEAGRRDMSLAEYLRTLIREDTGYEGE